MIPILQWIGGKRQIINKLLKLSPKSYNTYYEPFFGAGALGFALESEKAVFNDCNKELMNFYKCFKSKEDYEKLINELENNYKVNHSKDFYLEVRNYDLDPDYEKTENWKRGARTCYLNKACYGALWRENKKGHFNSPWGRKDHIHLYDRKDFDNVFNYLQKEGVELHCEDFEEVVKNAKAGDFVYFDPPYDNVDGKRSFTNYNKKGFGKDEQIRLAKVFKELTKKGVYCMLTNHNTELVRELYKDFFIWPITTNRVVNSKTEERHNTGEEVIILNY